MKIMGILNVTPDSFSDGGLHFSYDQACFHAEQMIQDGADILDIGGESTRPGALPVSEQEELDRVIPIIEKLNQNFGIPISIDTLKPAVMQAALSAGVWMINDVNALRADGALNIVANNNNVKVCLMHMQGEPRTMQAAPHYENVIEEVTKFLLDRKQVCIDAGIAPERIFLDPGIGFGKNLEHNLQLLKNLNTLPGPILLGVSRKAMLGKLLNTPENQRLSGSLALAVWAATKNVNILRVHDVKETVQARTVIEALL